MRHSVTTLTYLSRKALDNILYALSAPRALSLSSVVTMLGRVPFATPEPRGWLPLYNMVTFRPDISYATAQRKAARQAFVVTSLNYAVISLLGVTGMSLLYSTLREARS
jgi:kynurenine 3-monooxygenase